MTRLTTAVAAIPGLLLALAAGQVTATTAGPDLFGYTAADEEEASVDYAWVDMSGGTDILGDMGDESCIGPIPLGFTFRFYGVEHDGIYVLSNGIVTFEPYLLPGMYSLQCPLPESTKPDDMISYYQHDFDPSNSAACVDCHVWYATGGTAPDRWWGLTYWKVPAYGGDASSAVTVQVVLYEGTDEVRVQVADLSGAATGGTNVMIGIESADGSAGLSLPGCNTPGYTHTRQAIVFSPPESGAHAFPAASRGWGLAGATIEHEFGIANYDAAAASFSVSVSGGSWTTTPSATTIDLAAFESAVLTVGVDVPAAAAPGSGDRSTITLTPASGTPFALTVTTSVQDPPDEWQVVTEMPNWVIWPATATEGDTLYVMGGAIADAPSGDPDIAPRSDYFQALDTSTMMWDDSVTGSLPPVPVPGDGNWGQAACGMNGRVYVAGGNSYIYGYTTGYAIDLFIYDVAGNSWSQGADMPGGRSWQAIVCDETHDTLYVIGGYGLGDYGHEYLGSDTLWSYDAATDTWDSTLSPHPLAIAAASAQMVGDGAFLVAGGQTGEFEDWYTVRSFTYTLATDTWEESGELNLGRHYQASAALPPDRMCLIGGEPSYFGTTGTTSGWECWMDGYWTPQIAGMPEPRAYFAAGSVGGTIYVTGGMTADVYGPAPAHTTAVERYPSGPIPDTETDAPEDVVADSPEDAPADMPGDSTSDTSTDAPEDTATDSGDGGGDDGCSCSLAS